MGEGRQVALELPPVAQRLDMGLRAAVELAVNRLGERGHAGRGARRGAGVALRAAVSQKRREAAQVPDIACGNQQGAHAEADREQGEGYEA